MKKTIILSVMAIALMSGMCTTSKGNSDPANSSGAQQVFNLDTTKLARGQTFYQCPMDPQVISDKPGNCSVCGMELSKMKKQ